MDRTLKEFIDPERLIGRLLYFDYNADEFQTYKLLRYDDVNAGSNFVFNYLSEGDFFLNIKDNKFMRDVLEFARTNPIILEYFHYENFENLDRNADEYNSFWFLSKAIYEDNVDEIGEKQLIFSSFADFYEKRTICEHNKEYVYDDLPDVPSNPDIKILPDDYNKIYYYNSDIETVIGGIYLDNIIGNNVVNRVKGDFHVLEPSRAINGFQLPLNFKNMGSVADLFTILLVKQSAFNVREHCINILRGNNNYNNIKIDLWFDFITKKLNIDFRVVDSINLTKGQTTDTYQFYGETRNILDSEINILVESSEDNNKSTNVIVNNSPVYLKQPEGLTDASQDENNENLQDFGIAYANEQQAIVTTQLLLSFTGKEYFKDIHPGQLVTLSGYLGVADGTYQIQEIQLIVNQTYIEYEITKLDKIS